MQYDTFLSRLRNWAEDNKKASLRPRIPIEIVQGVFLESHPEYTDVSNIRAPLMEAINALVENDRAYLPSRKNKKLWSTRGNPNMPKWLGLYFGDKQMQVSTISLLPELGAIEKKLSTQKQRADLYTINKYLLQKENLTPIPLRERSLLIFGDEHHLDSSKDGLFGGRLPLQYIGAFDPPEPMPYERPPSRIEGRPVLIVENHHSFWSFCQFNIATDRYSAICFTSGNNLRNRLPYLEEIGKKVGTTTFEYFGDIDPPGLSIPARENSRRISKGLPGLVPATWCYNWLLSHGRRNEWRPKKGPSESEIMCGLDWFSSDSTVNHKVAKMFRHGLRIPQESLTFKNLMRLH